MTIKNSLITILKYSLLCNPMYFIVCIEKHYSKWRFICCQISEGIHGAKEAQLSLHIVTLIKANKRKLILFSLLLA